MQTDYGRDLYTDVLALTTGEESPFYFQEFILDDKTYRIFNYRLASYTDFCQPSGLEVRGHMFEVKDGKYVRLAALPPPKFFNNKENPFVMDVDFSKTTVIMDKMDGSIMTTFTHNDTLMLKSKGSLVSEQGAAANAWLAAKAPAALINYLSYMTAANYSVTLEWTAPQHRIVLPYQVSRLTVLCARSLDNGEFAPYYVLHKDMEEFGCLDYLVKDYYNEIRDRGQTAEQFIDGIIDMKGIEGYVVIADGIMTKHKCNWYCALHASKDSVSSDKRLYECVVNEAHDDLRAMFPDDAFLIGRIDRMEAHVKGVYQQIKVNTEDFHEANKHLDRKEYAIKGQAELDRLWFALAMNLYLGKETNFKEWLIKHWPDFAIADELLTPIE